MPGSLLGGDREAAREGCLPRSALLAGHDDDVHCAPPYVFTYLRTDARNQLRKCWCDYG